MKVKLSEDSYERLWLNWQFKLAVSLKSVLANRDISGELAKDVVGEFLFAVSMTHDQHGLDIDGKTVMPRLGFVDETDTLITTDGDTYMHEAAFAMAHDAFGDQAEND